MPQYRVTGPDGATYNVTAPEGASEAQVMAYVRAKAAPKAAAPEPAPKRQSFVEGVRTEAMRPVTNLARVLETATDAAGVTDEIAGFARSVGAPGTVAESEAARAARREREGVEGSGAGRFVGTVVGTAPSLLLPGGPLAQGAAASASITDERDPIGVAKDAAWGAATSFGADRVVRGLSSLVSPQLSKASQTLKDAKIPQTIGQSLGGAAKWAEEKATSLPILGAAIRGAYRRSHDAFNRAALNKAVAPIKDALPDDVPAGHDGVKWIGDRLSGEYQALLPKLNTRLDKTFVTRIKHLRRTAELPPEAAKRFESIFQTNVRDAFDPATGTMSGKKMKALDETLRRQIERYKVGAPDDRALADALGDLRGHLRAMVRRSNPVAAKRLQAIDTGWAHLARLEKAAAGTADGTFTPKQLAQAIRSSDKSVRRRQNARGEAVMQEFAKAGVEGLSPDVPDSGTAGRWLQALGLGGAIAEPTTAAITAGGLAAAAAPYTRAGQRVVTPLMTGRQSPTLRTLADRLALARVGAPLVPALIAAPQGQ